MALKTVVSICSSSPNVFSTEPTLHSYLNSHEKRGKQGGKNEGHGPDLVGELILGPRSVVELGGSALKVGVEGGDGGNLVIVSFHG